MTIKHNIFIREPDQQLPEDVRQKLMSTYKVAWGFASPQEDKMVHSAIFNSGEDNLADTLAKIDEGYKSDRVFYNFFDAGDDEINLESIQPFSLIDNGKEGDDRWHFVQAMVEGELDPKYKSEDGELFTPEYIFVNSFLQPLIKELFEIVGEDIQRLMGALDKPVTENKIIAELGPRATVVIIPCQGKAKAIVKNNNESGKWTWGFATRNIGISEQTPEPVAAAPKGQGLKAALKGMVAPAAVTAGGSPLSPEEQFKPLLKNDKFAIKAGVLWVTPPKGTDGKVLPWKDAKTFWNAHCSKGRPEEPGDVYAGWKFDDTRPASPIRVLKAKLMGEINEEDKEPKKADNEQAIPPKKEPSLMTLFIPAKDKETYLGYVEKNKTVPDVGIGPSTIEELVAVTKETPTASVQLGTPLSDLLMISKEGYNRMPGHLRTCVMHEFRMKCLELMGRIKAEAEPANVTVPKEPVPAETNPNEAKPKLGLKAGLKAGLKVA